MEIRPTSEDLWRKDLGRVGGGPTKSPSRCRAPVGAPSSRSRRVDSEGGEGEGEGSRCQIII